jgi:hypothetical protein
MPLISVGNVIWSIVSEFSHGVKPIHFEISVVHDLQLTQFDGHSADIQANISGTTIKLSQLKVVHNTDLEIKGNYKEFLRMSVSEISESCLSLICNSLLHKFCLA